ncbi:hypothetical protein [Paraburkholderia kururiensis]|uniref:hypothetical protein n=1 Tax=Paraburkholderia kururiensis TaxID=984307 RepID=UPI0018F303D5|nr:hypothetical protein [Paraburkholderia kururiensis]
MKRHIVAGLVPLLAQAAFAAQPVVAGAAGVAGPEQCLSRPQLSREQTPVVLNRAMVACAAASRWDAAVFLFAPGGVYGAYDAARVADPTAGQAARGPAVRRDAGSDVGTAGREWRAQTGFRCGEGMGRRGCGIPAVQPEWPATLSGVLTRAGINVTG